MEKKRTGVAKEIRAISCCLGISQLVASGERSVDQRRDDFDSAVDRMH